MSNINSSNNSSNNNNINNKGIANRFYRKIENTLDKIGNLMDSNNDLTIYNIGLYEDPVKYNIKRKNSLEKTNFIEQNLNIKVKK